jgi:Ran GTPase-activating protein (RanGAP) involved in mRNA processing and transport
MEIEKLKWHIEGNTWYLNNQDLTDDDVKLIFDYLKSDTSVTELSLGGNQIGDKGAESLGKTLESNESLTELDLWDNQIGDKGAESLGKALESNKSLAGHC